MKHLQHLENERIREGFLKEGYLIETLNKQTLDMGKRTSRIEETKAENLESGGQVGPILAVAGILKGSTKALGEKAWPFQMLPHIQR